MEMTQEEMAIEVQGIEIPGLEPVSKLAVFLADLHDVPGVCLTDDQVDQIGNVMQIFLLLTI
jgi:hypothetical protein